MEPLNYRTAMETVVFNQFRIAFKAGCNRCVLSSDKCNPIVYRGSPESDILLVGEAPGKEEEEQKLPLVGPAGKMLDSIMKALEISTEKDMVIMNSVFCSPLGDTPTEFQIGQCWPFVERAIRLLKPKVIIACGDIALSQLTQDTTVRMGSYEGKWKDFIRSGDNPLKIPMFTMTHPEEILRKAEWPDEQRAIKTRVWKYMQYFRDTYKDKINDTSTTSS